MAASISYGMATYFYYEKVRRTMRTAILSNLLNKVLRSAIMKRSWLKNKAKKTRKAVDILNYIKQRNLVVKTNNEQKQNILIN